MCPKTGIKSTRFVLFMRNTRKISEKKRREAIGVTAEQKPNLLTAVDLSGGGTYSNTSVCK